MVFGEGVCMLSAEEFLLATEYTVSYCICIFIMLKNLFVVAFIAIKFTCQFHAVYA